MKITTDIYKNHLYIKKLIRVSSFKTVVQEVNNLPARNPYTTRYLRAFTWLACIETLDEDHIGCNISQTHLKMGLMFSKYLVGLAFQQNINWLLYEVYETLDPSFKEYAEFDPSSLSIWASLKYMRQVEICNNFQLYTDLKTSTPITNWYVTLLFFKHTLKHSDLIYMARCE